jgi:hypothetical protein
MNGTGMIMRRLRKRMMMSCSMRSLTDTRGRNITKRRRTITRIRMR